MWPFKSKSVQLSNKQSRATISLMSGRVDKCLACGRDDGLIKTYDAAVSSMYGHCLRCDFRWYEPPEWMLTSEERNEMKHHSCGVCNSVGHEEDMVHVKPILRPDDERLHLNHFLAWVHKSCLPGSVFDRRAAGRDRRKQERKNDAQKKGIKS